MKTSMSLSIVSLCLMCAGAVSARELVVERGGDIDRYKGGQNILKQGLLQVDGTPYEELVDWVQKNNWRIHEQFLSARGEKK